MEINPCVVMLGLIPGMLLIGGAWCGLVKLYTFYDTWQKTPPSGPPINHRIMYVFKKAAKPLTTTVCALLAVGLIYLGATNLKFNGDCDDKQRAALGMPPQPMKVAGVTIPCPCGCGKHK